MKNTTNHKLNLIEGKDSFNYQGLNENFEKLDELLESIANFSAIPKGVIWMWHGTVDNVPEGWAICDGNNGTPDLRGRFVLGVSDNHGKDSKGGSEKVVLTTAEMPSHSHRLSSSIRIPGSDVRTIPINPTATNYQSAAGSSSTTIPSTTTVGSGSAHNNMPPYYALYYIMKL